MLPANTSLSTIPSRLKLYEKCRFERASTIQEYSRVAGKDLGSGPPVDAHRFTAYNFGHDEWDYSSQMLRKWEWENKKDLYWRMPTSFGPMPGPRQNVLGIRRDGSKARFTTASVKFKSSRTVLENLFPTEKFKFTAPDTVAYATFAFTQLSDLEWLGGRGYSHFGLYIHGVECAQENGEKVTGTYLPVLFENLADPILSGREELGFPKLFCDLDAQRDPDGSTILEASWMGSIFCNMALSGLDSPVVNGEAHTSQAAATKDEGLLFHKYIPTTGDSNRGKLDVEYTAFLPSAEDAKSVERKVERTVVARKAEVAFNALDWTALPTLHHIIARLQEVPVYEIMEAKIVEGTGVSDVSSVRKLAYISKFSVLAVASRYIIILKNFFVVVLIVRNITWIRATLRYVAEDNT